MLGVRVSGIAVALSRVRNISGGFADVGRRRYTVRFLGDGQGELVSVLGDLQVGDRVAIRGVERLQDGQAVKPII